MEILAIGIRRCAAHDEYGRGAATAADNAVNKLNERSPNDDEDNDGGIVAAIAEIRRITHCYRSSNKSEDPWEQIFPQSRVTLRDM